MNTFHGIAMLKVCRVELSEANDFVGRFHRHHRPVTGHRFSVGVGVDGVLRGVAIVGRPVARRTDQKHVAEVLRCCTDGFPNACSNLYGACTKICRLMGFVRIQTFILESELGVSLRACGWVRVGVCSGGSWSRPSRVRGDGHPLEKKVKWVCDFV